MFSLDLLFTAFYQYDAAQQTLSRYEQTGFRLFDAEWIRLNAVQRAARHALVDLPLDIAANSCIILNKNIDLSTPR